ncbi:hypothetical protein O5706_04940 [Escherichia coli]|nr:hypothetical protein [Escherichia coli]MCZ6084626.1 hypothetical protein [Escherichia coli]MCZ6217232.1 hypothetical protein [Escherichia coli]
MKLYIANCSRQPHTFNYKLPEKTQSFGVTIPSGRQHMIENQSDAKWHLNRSQFGIRIDHDLASISDHSLASQSITIWHASDH